MMKDDDIDHKLKSIGFTQYEIKTLKVLIALKRATADAIHKQTDIPTPRIYDTIANLEKKGLVRVIQGRPKQFEIPDLEKALENYIEFKKREYAKALENIDLMSKQIIQLVQDPEASSHLIIKPDELLEAYSTLSEMESKTLEIIKQAHEEVCIFTNVFYWFNHVEKAILDAINRNVSVRVLMSVEDQKSRKIAKKLLEYGVNVRDLGKHNVLVRGTLVDKEQVVFVIWVSPISRERYVYRPHFSSNPGIIEIFANNFEFLWNNANKLGNI
ncbi:MAG: TrmB family transcriptional regulator [Candidatus Heimdallarchaeaceae archaeon]